MKKASLFLISFLSSFLLQGQDITGQWYGILKIPGTPLRIVFNIDKTADGFSSTMDSPDQKVKGIPVSKTSFEDTYLSLEIVNLGIAYTGKLEENRIVGTFKQAGQSLPLDLSKEIIEKPKIARPQHPDEPYPYYSEDVIFENIGANLKLAGTLTLPEKTRKYPAVILISGSGPQNRDEEIFEHKPFLVLSDYLTKRGIAVLRYDDRGIAESTGDFSSATSMDFATDVEAAITYLKTRKEVDVNKIGLIGHSEGGLIAPIVAKKSKDVDFIVLLAGPGLPGYQVLLTQQELILKASGFSEQQIKQNHQINKGAYDIVINANNQNELISDLNNYFKQLIKDIPGDELLQGLSEDAFIQQNINILSSPWMKFFIKHDPATVLERVKCPVLAVNGEKDLQVCSKDNLYAIEMALKNGENNSFTIIEFPNLNHLFQECETGLHTEYINIEQTFSPLALEEINTWIIKQVY